jgi:hypothetical protein
VFRGKIYSKRGVVKMKKYNAKFIHNHLSIILDESFVPNESFSKAYYNQIPHDLYKFRECNDNNFKALEGEYVWLTTADKYTGDLVDSTLLYETSNQRNKIAKVVKQHLPNLVAKELRKHFEKKGFKVDPSIINAEAINAYATEYNYKSGYPRFSKIRSHLLVHGVKPLAINQYEKFVKNIFDNGMIEKLADKFIKGINSLNKTVQGYNYVSSFTSTYKNNLLWEFYTEKRKGFCIHYDLSKLEELGFDYYPYLYAFTPMFYTKRKEADISKVLDLALNQFLGDVKLEKIKEINVELGIQIRNKEPKYNGEDEWRLFLDRKKTNSPVHKFPFTKAVYAGADIKEADQDRLMAICKNKGYSLYKQKLNMTKSEYLYSLIYKP